MCFPILFLEHKVKNMKLIVFIHTCQAYEETRAKRLEQTWANNADTVFITDNDQSELKNHVCIGPYLRGPTYHPENVKKMFRLFLEKYSDYDYFMIVDDDTYVYLEKLKVYLSFFDQRDPYMIGDFLNWPCFLSEYRFGGNYEHWVGGGPGIVFTKSCIEEFQRLFTAHDVAYINHDVWLHYLFKLSDGKIKRTHCPAFHQYNESVLHLTFSKKDNRMISVHLNHNLDLLQYYHPV